MLAEALVAWHPQGLVLGEMVQSLEDFATTTLRVFYAVKNPKSCYFLDCKDIPAVVKAQM